MLTEWLIPANSDQIREALGVAFAMLGVPPGWTAPGLGPKLQEIYIGIFKDMPPDILETGIEYAMTNFEYATPPKPASFFKHIEPLLSARTHALRRLGTAKIMRSQAGEPPPPFDHQRTLDQLIDLDQIMSKMIQRNTAAFAEPKDMKS